MPLLTFPSLPVLTSNTLEADGDCWSAERDLRRAVEAAVRPLATEVMLRWFSWDRTGTKRIPLSTLLKQPPGPASGASPCLIDRPQMRPYWKLWDPPPRDDEPSPVSRGHRVLGPREENAEGFLHFDHRSS